MKNTILKILLLALAIVSLIRSYMGELLFPNYVDELLIILVIVYSFMKGKISSPVIAVEGTFINLFILFAYGVIVAIIHGIDINSSVADIIDIMKIPVFFLLFLYIDFDYDIIKYLKITYLTVSIPSLLMGLAQWYAATFMGIYWGISIYRDRFLGARTSGLAGHNIALGFTAFIAITIILEKLTNTQTLKKKLFFLLLFIIAVGALLTAQSRLPIAITLIYIIYKYFYVRLTSAKRFIMNLVTAFTIVFAMLDFTDPNTNSQFENEENTIRYKTITIANDAFSEHPLLGYGLGSYGIPQSLSTSKVYLLPSSSSSVREIISRGGTREAFMFQILIEFGLVGVILYYLLFIKCTYAAYHNKCYSVFFLMLFGIIIQSMLNGMYQMPVFFYLAIMTSFALKNNDPDTVDTL